MDDSQRITIARRFNGPPDSGNGGYVCGALAVATGEDVRVRLMAPPPLDRALAVEPGEQEGSFVLRDGDRAIAAATGAHLQLEVPSAPPYVQAVWAAQHYVGFRQHAFPDCFVCGPHRRRGDGLRIFAGLLDSGIVAAPWLPADDLDGGDGKVAVEFHWAALDCPGYFAIVEDNPRMMVLGEMQAHVDRRVHVGESCTVIGWRLGSEGRKHRSGTAIFDKDGELCARALATWIEVRG
ncbi:MAG TPA: hypothetical protein VF851_05175 [Steroidobacteraceae bacterium]